MRNREDIEIFYDGAFGFERPTRAEASFGECKCRHCKDAGMKQNRAFTVRFTGEPDYIVSRHSRCGCLCLTTVEDALAGNKLSMEFELAFEILKSLLGAYDEEFGIEGAGWSYIKGNPNCIAGRLYKVIFE